jgi:hypothetical protein
MTKRNRLPDFSIRLLDTIAREVRLEHSFLLVTRETSFLYNPTTKRFTQLKPDTTPKDIVVSTVIYESAHHHIEDKTITK